jgi:hypothetical protein
MAFILEEILEDEKGENMYIWSVLVTDNNKSNLISVFVFSDWHYPDKLM